MSAATPPEITRARRMVVKIGSALLVDEASGRLREDWLAALAGDIATLRRCGCEVTVVSSGAIALGRALLGLPGGDLALERSQAAAAAGQIDLARAWETALAAHGLVTAQVLVTLEDTADRRRYLNIRSTLRTLLGLGAVPIVNENDTIATDEIRYGDNDRLGAQIAATIGADQMVLLSDVDGLYDADPRRVTSARHIATVTAVTPAIEAMAGDAGTGLARGGMRTKLMAAATAIKAGCATAITCGTGEAPLSALAAGARATWFLPEEDPRAARKRWIMAMKPKGTIAVDAGAVAALARGKSLLPAGVTAVRGDFGRGDPVAIDGPDGRIGGGLVRYTSAEARAIMGRRSDDIAAILGYPGRAALIHRDDMVL